MKRLLIAFILLSTVAYSQQTDINNIQDVFTVKNDIGDKYNPYDPEIKGTAFIHSEQQNISIQGVKMMGKYNANQDYIELDKEGKTAFFLPAIEYRYEVVFTDLNTTYQAFEYKKFKYGFFKIVAKKEGAFLLCKEFIKLKAAVKPKSSFETFKPAKFERKKDSYYFKFKNQDLVVELPTRKNKYYTLFKNHSNAIKSFVKKEKLGIKKEEDLIKIFNYYNTL